MMANYPVFLSMELPAELFTIEAHGTPTVVGSATTASASAASGSASTTGGSTTTHTTVDQITVDTDATQTTTTTEGQNP